MAASTDYSKIEYWDARYLGAGPAARFDWLQTYDTLRPSLAPLLRPDTEILVLGCGNSRLPEALHSDGFPLVTSVDASAVVISHMAAQCASRTELEFACMDARALHYPDDCFGVVIDKGLTDTLAAGADAAAATSAAVREAWRVLRPGGWFICVSHGAPADRLFFL
eukprot:TRINITY_DN757_c0_g1_i1.p3 TRINITY_DN757_c0_g1~~TRINITY_DN757_c0_g1_i1.p3  ORF type:complete len:166 (+),score=66.98 TRINITY_DN757_c0_g1_i1:126-623(+)